ncbi:uncharacterized protein [Haliotis asinina]|uniref:uncharacterized protein n=1 Tax=Haliotis asinina TaxID=109174 RepID=UPI0035322327
MKSFITCLSVAMVILVSYVQSFPSDHNEINDGSLDMRAANYVETSTTTESPAYVKRRRFNCTDSHRPHENDTNKFQVFHNNVWWDQVCQTGLIWNQTLCRCEYSSGLKRIPKCPDYRAHSNDTSKYEQLVNGKWIIRECNLAVTGLLWNQTACRCVWGPDGEKDFLSRQRATPCDTMFNVTFDNGILDNAKSSYIELSPSAKISLRESTQKGNKYAYLEDGYMNVWYFAGNELSESLRVEFSFKAEDNPTTRDKYQIILSNGCNVTALGYTTPSLAIGYRAADESFLLAFETINVRKAIVCTRELVSSPYDWHRVSLIYEDGTLLLRVDNQPCIISEDFTGPVQKTSCPLTVGTDPLEKETKYRGYIDDILVARYCRRFVEQVPLDDFDLHDYNEEETDDTENLIDTFSNIDVGFKALL